MKLFKKIWTWYKESFLLEDSDRNNVKLNDLVWLSHNVSKRKPFDYCDSIEFDIESILTKREVELEMISVEQAKQIIGEEQCVARN